MTQPLAGLKVLEIGQAYAGPLAGMILADMGADVIKVEKPDGGDDARQWGPPFVGDDSAMFHANNRGKRSIALDIKDQAAVARLKELACDADILIQNLRPGVVEPLGLGPDALLAVNPRLIYCSIWAFGYTGPMRLDPGFDPLLQAYGAVMTLTGRPDDPPTFCAPAINDAATGMWCVIGALAALQQRHLTGRGCVIDTSLFETAVHWVSGSLHGYWLSGNVPQRHGTASPALVPYQAFETADRPIVVAAGNDRLFAKFAEAIGCPQWRDDPRFSDGRRRAANRPTLIALIEPLLRARPRDHWLKAFGGVGVPCSPINDIAELAQSEQLAAMDLQRTLPGSAMQVVGLPISFDRKRPRSPRSAPKLGEHTAEVLKELK